MDNDQLHAILDEQLAGFFGALEQRLDKRFSDIDVRFDQVMTTLDGIAKRISDDDIERAAIVSHQERQDGWISQLARVTDTKLVPEQ